jgi:hypothetical protein
VLGFFVWNFPAGLIFLGDGGAYFLGFWSPNSILLLVRNPEVSPLFPLLVCIYPVFETLFSIYRRRSCAPCRRSMPDGIHLHSLIYRRVMRWAVGDRSAKALTRRNSMTSPVLWVAVHGLGGAGRCCSGTTRRWSPVSWRLVRDHLRGPVLAHRALQARRAGCACSAPGRCRARMRRG